MKVRNTSSKIINIGSTILLPDAEMTVGKEFENAPSIKSLERMGMLRIIEEAVKVKEAPVVDADVAPVEEAPKKSRSRKKKAEEKAEEAEAE